MVIFQCDSRSAVIVSVLGLNATDRDRLLYNLLIAIRDSKGNREVSILVYKLIWSQAHVSDACIIRILNHIGAFGRDFSLIRQ